MTRTTLIDALKATLRVWVFTTLGLWIPGLLGWVHEVSQWASQNGAPPFPDASNLAFLFVAALTAAFPAALTLLVRILENAFGRSVLPRAAGPETPPVPGQHGQANLLYVLLVIAAFLLVLWLLVRVA